MYIGAHVGVADGYPEAVDYAARVGCECLQVFCKSPRQWHAKPLDPATARAFRERLVARAMGPVFVHTAYLINLGSTDDALWERSTDALADELRRAEVLGATAVVTHLGTCRGQDPERGARRIAEAIDRAWELARPRSVRLLLENASGAGTTFGSTPDELGAVVQSLGVADRTGVCLDTCHAHAAGWDLSSPGAWSRVRAAFETACRARIDAVHANDSAFPAGSHRDRHAWIGDGTIGYQGFEEIVGACAHEERTCLLTEMPGEKPEKDVENLKRLRRLRDASAGHGPSA